MVTRASMTGRRGGNSLGWITIGALSGFIRSPARQRARPGGATPDLSTALDFDRSFDPGSAARSGVFAFCQGLSPHRSVAVPG